LESRGELKAALAACTEAAATYSGSKSGKAAAEKARTLKARIDAEERAEVERRRKAAEEEKRGIETECHGLLASFVSAEEQARSRFMYKNVRTGGQVTRSPADGKLTFCSHGSDAEGVAADILCILGSTPSTAVLEGTKPGDSVKVRGRVANYYSLRLDLGVMAQLTLNPCEIIE